MKIYLLKVDPSLQPSSQPMAYPSYNDDYGVEQDFLKYVSLHQDLLVSNPSDADWHYLPVYWTRWHLNHDYGKTGLDTLQALVDKTVMSAAKTFTVCQYDDGPVISLGSGTLMLSSRQSGKGVDIPLLSKPLKAPLIKPRKVYLASFIGRLATHPIRSEMNEQLKHDEGIRIVDKTLAIKEYVSEMLKSYVALCPRGYGGSSFRFYEAMQLGVVPFLIGDVDTRPFKADLPWDAFSFYTNDVKYVHKILEEKSQSELLSMGKLAKKVWANSLQYLKWEKYAIKNLSSKP